MPSAAELIQIRRDMGVTQQSMARRMGLGLRTYQELEGDDRDILQRHIDMASFAALKFAVERGDPMLAPGEVRRIALDLARLLTE